MQRKLKKMKELIQYIFSYWYVHFFLLPKITCRNINVISNDYPKLTKRNYTSMYYKLKLDRLLFTENRIVLYIKCCCGCGGKKYLNNESNEYRGIKK